MSGFANLTALEQDPYDGYLIGTVKDNNDPQKLQRIKVAIPRLLEGDVANLPWISPMLNPPMGFTSTAGVVEVPALGAQVVIKFQKGNIHYGLYHGAVPTASHTPNPALLLNYPNRRGWADTAGNFMWIDVTSGQTEMHVQHKSGTYIHIDNTGKVTVHAVTDVAVEAVNATVNASSSTTVTCPSNTINGNLTLNGNFTQTGNHSVTGNVTASGGTFTHNSKNVGSTHQHSGVSTGGGTSGAPI